VSTTDADVAAALRGRGVRIGLPAALTGAGKGFDFITLPASPDGLDAQLEAARRCRAAHPGITLVAVGLHNIDELERALQAGVTFVSGRFDAPRVDHGKRPPHTGVQRICQMLNRVVTDQDTALIARDIGVDVALSYRMLRYVNSPALGLTRAVDSIEQAVMLLGRDELYRWLSVLLLASVDGRKASRALQEVSLARARLLETLARERGVDPPAALFTVGLLSLMDALLQVPLDEALQPLHLGDPARQALLEHRGEWYEYLALAIDLERHDLEAAAVRAERFGGLDAVLPHAEQAWRWAAQVQATVGG
jgi:EAL and modified HD-GYP domain-containing signal transduction protein